MPRPFSKAGEYARNLSLQLGAAAGLRGRLDVLRVLAAGRRSGAEPAPSGVAMAVLGGRSLQVRPGASDLRNASYYYRGELFLPPPEVAGENLRQICELGSNMGAALTALAVRYPDARLLGVEPDPGNASLAARNVADFGDRCRVLEAGIWDTDADLVVDRDTRYGEHGFTVRPRRDGDSDGQAAIKALSIDSVLEEGFPESSEIDYMHVSIEGTEPRVFRTGGEWPARVRSLRVETHPALGYPSEACIADLEALGYSARPDPRLPEKWVFAMRARPG